MNWINPWFRLLPAVVAVAVAVAFGVASVRLDRVRVELAEVRQVNDALRDDLHAARAEAAAAHARGYAHGLRDGQGQASAELRGIKRAVNIIAAGCVYMPGAARLEDER